MSTVLRLADNYDIQLGAIREGPHYSIKFLSVLGLVYLNWGRLEQTLEFLLRFLDDPRLVTKLKRQFPNTSFRLKNEAFKELLGKHPRLKQFHNAALAIEKGLKKANDSRVKMVHSNFQYFKNGPPQTMEMTLVKFSGADLRTSHGSWPLQAILDFNELLCLLNDDLANIAKEVINIEFLKSLEKPLSRTERAILAARRLLNRLPRLRIEWPAPGLDDTDLSESRLPLELHRA